MRLLIDNRQPMHAHVPLGQLSYLGQSQEAVAMSLLSRALLFRTGVHFAGERSNCQSIANVGVNIVLSLGLDASPVFSDTRFIEMESDIPLGLTDIFGVTTLFRLNDRISV